MTLYFTPDGDETRILLVHEQLPDAEARRKHSGGWSSVIDRLNQYERGLKAIDDFQTTVRLPGPVGAVYAALTTSEGLSGWWTKFCTIGSHEGDENDFRFPGPEFSARFKIERLVPNSLVQWKCIGNNHPPQAGYQNPHDWIGTTVKFELQAIDPASTQLKFSHLGLRPELECNTSCRNGWWHFLHQVCAVILRTERACRIPAPTANDKNQVRSQNSIRVSDHFDPFSAAAISARIMGSVSQASRRCNASAATLDS